MSLINQMITKRDAANRQIEAAIRLFMSGKARNFFKHSDSIVHAYNAWFIVTEPDCKHESYENYLEVWHPDIKSASDKEQRVIGRQLIDDIISGKIII